MNHLCCYSVYSFDNPNEKVPDVKMLLEEGMKNVPALQTADLKKSKLFESWNKKFRVVVEDEDGIAVMNGADRPKQCPYTMVRYFAIAWFGKPQNNVFLSNRLPPNPSR